jgi:membrane dipeptidase
VADVAHFHGLGQRVSQLTYNTRNALGSGCYEATDRGLSVFGQRVVGEMDRLGMAVDVSHCGERTALDAVATSRRPVLITHGNCRALVPGQPRCRSDELLRAVARSGGVMGITVVRAFVSGKSRPALPDLLDHFDHVAKLAGVEHVGLDPVARIFQIADGLLGRGWSEPAVRLVLGGNFERALGAIWGAAKAAPEMLARDPFCPARSPRVPPVRERRDTLAGRDRPPAGGRGSGPPLR